MDCKHTKNEYKRFVNSLDKPGLLQEKERIDIDLMTSNLLRDKLQNPYGRNKQSQIKINTKMTKWKKRIVMQKLQDIKNGV